jgi:ABC-type branched-subunit amino acid transport system permease subunit
MSSTLSSTTNRWTTARLVAIAIALVVGALLPYWAPGTYYINIGSQILFYAIFALAIDILLGLGGLVSLGHAGIFGVTCYVVAVTRSRSSRASSSRSLQWRSMRWWRCARPASAS